MRLVHRAGPHPHPQRPVDRSGRSHQRHLTYAGHPSLPRQCQSAAVRWAPHPLLPGRCLRKPSAMCKLGLRLRAFTNLQASRQLALLWSLL